MLFQGFVNPLLVWGTLLAAVPLLIHLLNRQRHKPMQWAAMQFVLAAYKRTRRRAQLENLLLLLLRMAAVALLALAIARPFTTEKSPLAPLTESRRDVVLILDGSASTGYRDGVQSVHDAILARAREILTDYDGTRGDRVRLVRAGDYPRELSARAPEEALLLLPTLTAPTDEGLDLAALLTEVVGYAEEDAADGERSGLEVRLLTDLQRRSFLAERLNLTEDVSDGSGEEPGEHPLERTLDRLDELGVRVVVENLGGAEVQPPNLGIEDVAPLGDLLGPGLNSQISVRIKNHGASGRGAVRVALAVDGVRQPSKKVDVPARSAADVVFSVTFQESGPHALVASLEGDRLPVDDERAAVVHVPPAVRVLLVDGDPNPDVDRDEVGYLRAVLEPSDDGLLSAAGTPHSPFAVRVVPHAAFGAELTDLSDFDVVVLANVGSISPPMVDELESRVAAGGALVVTLGDRAADPTSLDALNARLWRPDGTGLLPARLVRAVEVKSRRDDFYRCDWFDAEHPVLAFFGDEHWRPYLTEIPIYAFVASEPLEETRVLARLDDHPDRSPLLSEREYDRGRVLLWTSSIDRDWNRVAESPTTFVPLVHELVRYAGRGDQPVRNVDLGVALAVELESFPRGVAVLRPDGSRRPLDGEPVEVNEGLWRLPAIDPLDQAGLWRVEWERGETPIAVHIDPEEGDLERMTPAELTGSHRAWKVLESGDEDVADSDDRPEEGELWRWFALAALTALILETLWAAWIGRGRRLA